VLVLTLKMKLLVEKEGYEASMESIFFSGVIWCHYHHLCLLGTWNVWK